MGTAEDSSGPVPPRRQAILILGMHRSGTSALAGVVHALGAAAPKTLSPVKPDNPRGYWESLTLTQAHDALLASAGSRWDDWRRLNPQWAQSKAAEAHRQAIASALQDEFGDAPLFVIKDPRICRFVPFYLPILADMNAAPVVLLPVRNPLEVAYSLKRRDGFPLPKSLLLWLRHALDAEYHSRQLPRYILPHEKFLLDWRGQIDRAAQRTGIVWPARSARSDAAIEQFLTPDLQHERATREEMEQHPDVAALVRETYRILSTMAAEGDSEELMGRLDAVRAKFEEGCDTFGAALAAEELTAEALRRDLDRRTAEAEQQLRAAREEHERALAALNAELARERQQAAQAQTALSAELAQQHEQVAQTQAALAQQRADNQRLNEALRRAAAEVEGLRATATRQNLEIRRHIDARDAAIGERAAMLASHSWRVTAPLRRLSTLFFNR